MATKRDRILKALDKHKTLLKFDLFDKNTISENAVDHTDITIDIVIKELYEMSKLRYHYHGITKRIEELKKIKEKL